MKKKALLTILIFVVFFLVNISMVSFPKKAYGDPSETILDALLDWASLIYGNLETDYNHGEGNKHIGFISGSVWKFFGGSIYIDLDDYKGITPEGEGEDGYVTVWINIEACLCIPSVPIALGLTEVPININKQDPPFIGKAVIGSDIETPIFSYEFARYDENGWSINDIDIQEYDRLDLSIGILSAQFGALRFEIKKKVLVEIFSSTNISNIMSPYILFSSIISHFVSLDSSGEITLRGPFRFFTEMDNGTSFAFLGNLLFNNGGIDIDGDGIGNNVFPITDDIFHPESVFLITVYNDGTQPNSYLLRLKEESIPNGWQIEVQNPAGTDKKTETRLDLAEKDKSNTVWHLISKNNTPEEAELEFELSYVDALQNVYPLYSINPIIKTDFSTPTIVEKTFNNTIDAIAYVRFSEDMDDSTFLGNINIIGSISGDHTAAFTFNHSTYELTIDPIGNFSYGETVTITIKTGVQDLAGNRLDSQYPFSFTIGRCPTLEVTPQAIKLYVSEASGSFDKKINITNSGSGTFNWSISENSSWISIVSSSSGTVPSIATISINPSGLSIGTYIEDITITATGACESPRNVNVTLIKRALTPLDYGPPYGPYKDTYITGGCPDCNNGSESELYVGWKNFRGYNTLIQFEKGNILNQDILSAKVRLYIIENYGNPASIKIGRIMGPWDETITFRDGNGLIGQGDISPSGYNEDYIEWDVTDIIQYWADGPLTGHGLHFVMSPTTSDNGYFVFSSREGNHPPQFFIQICEEFPNPDFVVSKPQPHDPSMTPISPPFFVGQQVEWSVTVTNNDSGCGKSSVVGYYLGNSPTDLNNRIISRLTDAILGGDSTTVSNQYPFADQDVGTKYLNVWINDDWHLPETNDNNNTNSFGPFEVKNPPNYSISANPVERTISQQQSAYYNINLTSYYDFDSPVNLSISGLPEGTNYPNYQFNPNPIVPPGSAWLTINTSENTPLGTYTINVNASGGEKSYDLSLTLEVFDGTNPVATITSPTNDSIFETNTSILTIQGTVTDSGGSGLSSVNINTGNDNNGTTENWSFTVDIAEEDKLIIITAVDNAGNMGSDALSINYNPFMATLSVSPTIYDFGSVTISDSLSHTFTITNTGSTNIEIGTISIISAHAEEFSKQSDACSGQTLTPLGNCTVTIDFVPASEGTKTANLSIPSNDPNAPTLDVPMSGTGIQPFIDTDNDGMPDNWEVSNGLDPNSNDATLDPDNDGLTNLTEYQNSTDPNNEDTDADGLSDMEELFGLRWRVVGNMPIPRHFMANPAVEVGGKFYLIGGQIDATHQSTVGSYEPATDTWATLTPLQQSNANGSAVAFDNKIYLFGGYGGQFNKTWKYDPTANLWIEKENMPTGREGAAAAYVGGKIYVIGGENNGIKTVVEAYDPVSDSWSTGFASIPLAVNQFTFAETGGKIYIINGHDSSGEAIKTVQIYNPSTDSWSTGSDITTARLLPTASVINGKIYVTGGITSWNEGEVLDSVEMYDPETDSWRVLSALPNRRLYSTSGVLNENIYIFPGRYGSQDVSSILEGTRNNSNPLVADTDDDGMPDGWEVRYNLNPLFDDSSENCDSDSYTNFEELIGRSDPCDSSSIPVQCIQGDFNDDGQVNILDAIQALNIILNLVPAPTTDLELCRCDLDYNDRIDIIDLTQALGKILGLN